MEICTVTTVGLLILAFARAIYFGDDLVPNIIENKKWEFLIPTYKATATLAIPLWLCH